MSSPTTENYLKAIYALAEKNPESLLVKLGELSQELGVTPGTITTMIRRLAERGLVDYQARKGVRLTEPGRIQALQVLRRHRLIETFLVEVMHMDWSEVHEDAEALEHAVSDQLVERMADMMGHPSKDPHGDPIPTLKSEMPDSHSQPLSDAQAGNYIVTRVNDQDPSFLEWMGESGLKPGTVFHLEKHDARSGVLTLHLSENPEPLAIGSEIARQIRVGPADS